MFVYLFGVGFTKLSTYKSEITNKQCSVVYLSHKSCLAMLRLRVSWGRTYDVLLTVLQK